MIKDSDLHDLLPNRNSPRLENFYDKMIYVNKSEVTDEKILLILPCNSGGANMGSYFLAGSYPYRTNNWRKSDLWLRNLRSEIYFAAQSCVEFKYHDGNGALVFEHEMSRVKNNFDFGKPAPDVFTFDNNQSGFNMFKMVDDLKFGLDRALRYGFSRIISIQTPLSYKMGFFRAVSDLGLWNSITLIDSKIGTFEYFLKLVNVCLVENITGLLYHPVWSYSWNDKRVQTTPKEFQYMNSQEYKDITQIVENFRVYGNSFEHFCPKLKSDILSFTELIDKYKFPYRTPFYQGSYVN